MKPIISYKQLTQPEIKKPKLVNHRDNLSNTWYTKSTCSHYLHKFIVNSILTPTCAKFISKYKETLFKKLTPISHINKKIYMISQET